jgi:hypothetical protein
MSGDYTRIRYSPRSGYIGVLEQQGRVRLDADGNELVDAIDRRHRAECIDTIGFAVFPTDPVNGMPTINGFLITGTGPYFIGQGRGYVDGIQVDCWGDIPLQFQPNLGELVGQNPLPYDSQPFFYSPGFPEIPAAGNSIVYLDVWAREVTALEDPGLIDPAIEGIDTTTRIQAAWQVKAIATSSSACSDSPTEWTSLIAPSTGVLSTAPAPAVSGASPCIIDPVSGYTGLENRLYRVQIYTSGTVGGGGGSPTATFVWSDNNASLGAGIKSVTSLTATSSLIGVTTVGRDRSFGFQVGDILEVLDDYVEWSIRETNNGGQLVTVLAVDPEQLTVTADSDLSGWFGGLPAGINVNPRLRKWAADKQPTNNGVAIALSDGVTVTFGDDPAATLKAGDYWVFYARTATGQIETLSQAPPRGLHHYAKLAVVNPAAVPPVQDCRVLWPPTFGSEGCCTVVVKVGDDIQAAIDSLPPEQGGCICLKAGTHVISKPLSIEERKNIHLHGESTGAAVQNTASGVALTIFNNSENIVIEDIAFSVSPLESGKESMIFIDSCEQVAIRHCSVGSNAPNQQPFAGWGIQIQRSDGVELRGNSIEDCMTSIDCTDIIDSTANLPGLIVVENRLVGPTEQDGNVVVSLGLTAIRARQFPAPVRIEGNVMSGYPEGVEVQGNSTPLSITGNAIGRPRLGQFTSSNFGWTDPLGLLVQEKIYAIATNAPCAVISGNTIQQFDAGHGGILVFGFGAEVRDNLIAGRPANTPDGYRWRFLPVGVVAYKPAASNEARGCRIVANKIAGLQDGIAVLAEMADLYPVPLIEANSIPNEVPHQLETIDLTAPQNSIPVLVSSLQSLDDFFGILTINADRAAILHNSVSACTVGVACISLEPTIDPGVRVHAIIRPLTPLTSLTTPSCNVDGNIVDSSVIGVLLNTTVSNVLNGIYNDNQAGVVLYGTYEAKVTQNRSISLNGVVQYLDIQGVFTKLDDNYSEGGQTGIFAYQTFDLAIEQNHVITAQGSGIVAASCTDKIRFENNKVASCGVTGQSAIEANLVSEITISGGLPLSFGKAISAGIVAANCAGFVDVEGCEVRDTNQLAKVLSIDIGIVGAQSAGSSHGRVCNCRMVRPTPAVYASFGILLTPMIDQYDPSLILAHISGNFIDINSNPGSTSAAVYAGLFPQRKNPQAPGDILFNDNFVRQSGAEQGDNAPIVFLVADTLAVTGNRIRTATSLSLQIRWGVGLTFVGNAVNHRSDIEPTGGNLLPAPPNANNVLA